MLLVGFQGANHKESVAVARIGYARCSSEEQSANSNSLAYQAARLEEYCGVGNVVQDVISASKTPLRKRSGFQECVNRLLALPAGSRRVLLVTRLDRLSRRVEDIRYMNELMRQGIEFDSLDSGGVQGGAMGNFSLTMRLAMAEYEASLLSEKIAHRYVDRRKASQPMNVPPFGYAVERRLTDTGVDARLVPHPERADQARQIIEATIKHEGNLEAVLRDCVFERMPRSPRGLKVWLTNRVLLGHTIYAPGTDEEDVRWNTHEPLMRGEEFQAIAELLDRRARPKAAKEVDVVHPLTGIVRCPTCGRIATVQTRVYTCSGSKIGRYRRTPGEKTFKAYFSCRYACRGECAGYPKGAMGKAVIESLLDLTLQKLCEKSGALASSTVQAGDREVSAEERQLLAQIDAMKRMNQGLMAAAIRALEEQLEQIRFKDADRERQLEHRQRALMAHRLTPEAFKRLSPRKQNELLRYFVLRVVPAAGDRQPLIELLV